MWPLYFSRYQLARVEQCFVENIMTFQVKCITTFRIRHFSCREVSICSILSSIISFSTSSAHTLFSSFFSAVPLSWSPKSAVPFSLFNWLFAILRWVTSASCTWSSWLECCQTNTRVSFCQNLDDVILSVNLAAGCFYTSHDFVFLSWCV